MAQETVSAGYAKAMFDFAVSCGVDENLLFERTNFCGEDFKDLDKRLLMSDYIVLVKMAKKLTNDDALVLHFCENTNIEKFSIVGLICGSVPTIADALKQLNRFSQLVAETDLAMKDQRFQLQPDELGLWLEDKRTNPNHFYELTEATFGRFAVEFNRYFAGQPFLRALYVTHSKPSYAAEYDRLFGVPIHYDSTKNAMLVDPLWLMVEISPTTEYAFGILSKHAEILLQQLKNSASLKSEVESLLLSKLHTGDATMQWVAQEMALTQQTLYRKLKTENTNFEILFDELRHKMALHYLNGQKTSVNETAYLVGFADPSSFSKAFKRWTGGSPRQYKNQPQNG